MIARATRRCVGLGEFETRRSSERDLAPGTADLDCRLGSGSGSGDQHQHQHQHQHQRTTVFIKHLSMRLVLRSYTFSCSPSW